MVEVISVHMPKTAGTAFRHILYDVYEKAELLEDYPPDRMFDPNNSQVASSVKIVHGHFQPATKYDQAFPDAMKIVWLRHPIFRLISEYFFAKTINDKNNPIHVELVEKDLSLLEFAQLPTMRNFQQQYISGLSADDFFFIGIQEYYAEDIRDLGEILGWSAFEVSAKNRNKYPKYQDYLIEIFQDTALVNQLALINDADMKLYSEALLKRAKRRGESAYIQSTVADWNRAQFLLNESNAELRALRDSVEQLNALAESVDPESLGDIMISHNTSKAYRDQVLGFNIDNQGPKLPVRDGKLHLRGWIVGRHAEVGVIRAVRGETVLSKSALDRDRPDVANFLNRPECTCSGFEMSILGAHFARCSEVRIEAVLADGSVVVMGSVAAAPKASVAEVSAAAYAS